MLRLILLVVIIILVLSFFGISLQSLFHTPATQANFGFVWQLLLNAWNIFLQFFNGVVATIQGFINNIVHAGDNVRNAYE